MNNRKKYDKNYSSLKVVNGLLILLTLIIVSCSKDEDIIDFPNENAVGANNSEVGVEDNKINVSSLFYEDLLFICHRGLIDYPENTFAAVNAAVLSGFKAVECDICMTKDSVFVLQHDPTIDRCSDGVGKVNDMTYEQLLAYDFGSWKGSTFAGERIVRLDDLLDYFKKKELIIELDLADETRFKREWIPVLYELVKNKEMLGQTMFTATQDEFSVFLSEPHDIIISVSGVYRMSDATRALSFKDKVTLCNFSVPQQYLTEALCKYAHDNGIWIKTWTTTTQEEMERCISLGADYIITEVPFEQTPTTGIQPVYM